MSSLTSKTPSNWNFIVLDNSNVKRPNSLIPYILQLAVVPPAVGVCAIPCLLLYEALVGVWTARDGRHLNFEVLVIYCVGVLMRWSIGQKWREFEASALWIWVIPVLALGASFIEAWSNPFQRSGIIELHFQSSGSGEGLTRFLITDPAFSTAGYSTGALLTRILRGRSPADDSI